MSRCVFPCGSATLAKGETNSKTRIRNISACMACWDPGRKHGLWRWRCGPMVRGGIGGLWHQADSRSPAPACFSSWELISTSCRKPELESVVLLSLHLKLQCIFFNCIYVFICCGTSLLGHSRSENNSVTREQLQVGHRCRKHLRALCHPFHRGCATASPAPAGGGCWPWVRVSSKLL